MDCVASRGGIAVSCRIASAMPSSDTAASTSSSEGPELSEASSSRVHRSASRSQCPAATPCENNVPSVASLRCPALRMSPRRALRYSRGRVPSTLTVRTRGQQQAQCTERGEHAHDQLTARSRCAQNCSRSGALQDFSGARLRIRQEPDGRFQRLLVQHDVKRNVHRRNRQRRVPDQPRVGTRRRAHDRSRPARAACSRERKITLSHAHAYTSAR